jgi:hypothetical protein
MIKVKKKLCDGECGELRVIWKNSGGKRFCKSCWSAHSSKTSIKPTVKQKPISPRSPKRILQEAEYSAKRKVFLTKHPMCQMHLPGICTTYATDVHHMAGRTGDLLLDEQFWKAGCRACHTWVELHPKEAKEMGLSINRL